MTLGCLRAIRECDVKCPEELALISFDDLEWFEFTHPSVTAVVQNAYELGAGAAQILANKLAGKLTGRPWRRTLKTTLLIRESSRRSPIIAPNPA